MHLKIFPVLLITETLIVENEILTLNHLFDELRTIIGRHELTQRQVSERNSRVAVGRRPSDNDEKENCPTIDTDCEHFTNNIWRTDSLTSFFELATDKSSLLFTTVDICSDLNAF